MNIEKIKQVFDKHVQNYDMNENSIVLKYRHSYRVMYLCKAIAEDLNLKDKDVELAMLIGLLHDYGRFEQWKEFKTFSDINSVDHGDLAVKRLFNDLNIDKFDVPISYYQTIYEAIKYHNKYDYPEKTRERNKMFCRLIKDADKLDIFYLISIGRIPMIVDESKISEFVVENFFNETLLRKEDRKTNNDKILYYLSMMYDFNFIYSYKYIKETGILEKMFDLIDKNEKFEPYFSYMQQYINERSKEYVRKKI